MIRWLAWVAWEWLLICTAAVCAWCWPLEAGVAAWLLIGSRQHALAVLGHEAVHWAVAGRTPLNDRLGQWLVFRPLLADLHGYRAFHLQHHLHLGSLERAIYLPHHVWKHATHHRPGNWPVPAWDLKA